MLPAGVAFGDRFGRRRLLTFGVAIFTAMSLTTSSSRGPSPYSEGR